MTSNLGDGVGTAADILTLYEVRAIEAFGFGVHDESAESKQKALQQLYDLCVAALMDTLADEPIAKGAVNYPGRYETTVRNKLRAQLKPNIEEALAKVFGVDHD